MARTYHIDIAAVAADADRKWVDNLLSRFEIAGVDSARRGIARRINIDGLYRIALIRRLSLELGTPAAVAVGIADHLLDETPRVALMAGLELAFDRAAFEAEIDERIGRAVEWIRPARRGRPPQRLSSPGDLS